MALCLSRKDGQAVWILTAVGDVRVNVVTTRYGTVRLGFVAPENIRIFREEVLGRMTPAAASADCELCPSAKKCQELLDRLPWIHSDIEVEEGTDAAETADR